MSESQTTQRRKKVSIRVDPALYDKFKEAVAAQRQNKHATSDVFEDFMRNYVEKADNEEESMPSDSKEGPLQSAIKTVEEPPITRSAVPTIVPKLLRGEFFVVPIAFRSQSMKLFEYCRNNFNDPNMDISDLVNAVIQVFFEERGVRIVYVMDM